MHDTKGTHGGPTLHALCNAAARPVHVAVAIQVEHGGICNRGHVSLRGGGGEVRERKGDCSCGGKNTGGCAAELTVGRMRRVEA